MLNNIEKDNFELYNTTLKF